MAVLPCLPLCKKEKMERARRWWWLGRGWWSGWCAVVEGNGGRGIVREERRRANIVYKAYWLYTWSINLNSQIVKMYGAPKIKSPSVWCTILCLVHHSLSHDLVVLFDDFGISQFSFCLLFLLQFHVVRIGNPCSELC